MRRLLILGGTTEAVALAQALDGRTDLQAVISLAGRTQAASAAPFATVIGGFGGLDGLISTLRNESYAALVDATHPFAATISATAANACAQLRLPRLALWRPAWIAGAGDRWRLENSLDALAQALPPRSTAFLAIGRQSLAPFAQRPDVRSVVRLIDPPPDDLPLPDAEIVLGRGPFAYGEEMALFRDHAITCVVAKNSGGAGGRAKLEVARDLELPVFLLARPPAPPGPLASDAAQALKWIDRMAAGEINGRHRFA